MPRLPPHQDCSASGSWATPTVFTTPLRRPFFSPRTTAQRLSLEVALNSARCRRPTRCSSCGCIFFDRRTVFLEQRMVSTRTTTCSCSSDPRSPPAWHPSFHFRRGGGSCRDRLSRAMSRRTSRTRRRFHVGGALKAQIELLLLQLEHFVVDPIDRHCLDVGRFHDLPLTVYDRLAAARSAPPARTCSQHNSGLRGRPRAALARDHAHFERLLRARRTSGNNRTQPRCASARRAASILPRGDDLGSMRRESRNASWR